jgi:8-oxo-dGTP pyrophosphatase MutT (NUDIX family)
MSPPVPQPAVHLPVALGGVLCPAGVLLIQRSKPPYQGLWGLPGGKIEDGESPPAALRRELREECGLQITHPRRLGMLYEQLEEADGRVFRFDLNLFRVDLTDTPLPAGGAEGRVAFHPLEQLDLTPGRYIPTDLLIIRRMILPAAETDHETLVLGRDGRYTVRHFRPRR